MYYCIYDCHISLNSRYSSRCSSSSNLNIVWDRLRVISVLDLSLQMVYPSFREISERFFLFRASIFADDPGLPCSLERQYHDFQRYLVIPIVLAPLYNLKIGSACCTSVLLNSSIDLIVGSREFYLVFTIFR